MRLTVGLLTCLCLCGWAQAQTTDTPATPAVPAQPATSATPAAAPSDASAPATPAAATPSTAATASASAVSAADDKRARAQGYKPVMQNGTLLYCRSEPVVGSHFEHRVCRTQAQITADADQTRRVLEDKQIQPMREGGH